MVHACAACTLRFPSTGELRDHIATDHVPHPPVAAVAHRSRRPRLVPSDFTRSGWVVKPSAE